MISRRSSSPQPLTSCTQQTYPFGTTNMVESHGKTWISVVSPCGRLHHCQCATLGNGRFRSRGTPRCEGSVPHQCQSRAGRGKGGPAKAGSSHYCMSSILHCSVPFLLLGIIDHFASACRATPLPTPTRARHAKQVRRVHALPGPRPKRHAREHRTAACARQVPHLSSLKSHGWSSAAEPGRGGGRERREGSSCPPPPPPTRARPPASRTHR